MATSQSIGNLNASITANAEQFVAEFKKADSQAQASGQSITAQVDKISTYVEKRFSGTYFARSILSGLGIGTGFALAQKASELISKYWQEAADAAQKIEASTAAQLASTLSLIRARQTDAQQLITLQKQQAGLYAELGSVPKSSSGFNDFLGLYGLTSSDTTNQIGVRRAEIIAELQKTAAEIQALQDRIAAQQKAENDKLSNSDQEVLNSFARMNARTILPRDAYDALQANIVGAESQRAGATTDDAKLKANKAIKDSFDAMRPVLSALATDSQKWLKESETDADRYADALADINKEEEIGLLTSTQAASARQKAWESLDSVGKEVSKTFDSMFKSLSDDSAKAFSDMVLQGRTSFSDLVKIVEEAVIQLAAKLYIINPLINSLFGLTGTKALPAAYDFASMFFAEGGRPPVGQASIVGENGPELFVPDSAGTVIPNRSLASGASGGDTYLIDARGADEARISQLERSLVAMNATVERRAVGAVLDVNRRPSAARRMLRS